MGIQAYGRCGRRLDWLWVVLVLVALAGCGGANQEDVASITGQPPESGTGTPGARPTVTPTATNTATPTPAAAHVQVALFVDQASNNGDGTLTSVITALVTTATGAAVGDGAAVQFSLLEPLPGVSVTSPGLTGQAAPCSLGFPVVAQPGDALSCVKYDQARQGQTVTIQGLVQTPSGPLTSTQVITLPDLRPTATPTITPTATPTATPTPTVTPTATITPTPTPAAAHIQVALFANQASNNGDGTLTSVISALVTDATGAAVGAGVSVQFSLVAPVPAGVSVTSPGLTGQAAPCTLGFPVVPQPGDALSCVKYDQARQGQTVTVQALVQTQSGPLTSTQIITFPDLRTPTPSSTFTSTPTPTPTNTPTPTVTRTPTPVAAQIQVALFVDQASNNGDGTLTSVVSALVTDATGAVVGNGVAVQFSLIAPVPAGVSVTSPGLTGQAAPCTLGFTVVPQPGDALSCIKYDRARQGQTVTVQALVQTPSGPLTSTQVITLPDLRPTATPTFTTTATPTRTATPTPAAAQIQVALFVDQASNNGDGTLTSVVSALVTDATGAVVGNGVPVQFSLVAPVPAGVSVTSPGLTGQAAPCTLGFTVVPQPGDALSCIKYDRARQGQTVTVQALVQTPSGPLASTQVITLPDLRPTATATPTSTPTATPTSTPTITRTPTPAAAHIQVALFVNQASSNGDGTLSSVIGALVTDETGATVGSGVAVQFSLVAPVPAGVSVTSPGFTGQAAPCTLGFPVLAQPGDALSCVKYDQARQGQSVTVQALVQTPSGPLTSTQVITLPDLRTPTPTNTATVTPTNTPTKTPTATPAAAHIQVALFVNQASSNGDGTLSSVVSALVTDATGATVGNGVPVQFSLLAPVPAGVSVTSPGFTGQAVPCTLGFPVLPQPGDALSCVKYDQARQGQTVTVQALVQTPSGPLTSTQVITLPDVRTPTPTNTATFTPTNTPTKTPTPTPAAALIQVALFVNQASSNGDGTLSSVVSALVTDGSGATVGNGVLVQFSLVNPLPGVSVTSPGFTGQAPPCTLSFTVLPQPGDALSCVKYDQARQGQTVVVRALVQTPSGPLTSTQFVTLPDLRPTATPTPAPTLPPSSIQFVSATPVAIGVRQSGLPEQAVLTFRVTDANGTPVAGIRVNFNLTAIDEETIHPLEAFTGSDGLARTTLSSGARASTLRVVAGADSDGNGSPDLFAQSTAVAVFGAPPIQSRFSIAAEKLNVPGRVLFGVRDPISAFVNDRFGNAVPPGTAVTFVSNGASVVNQMATDSDGVAKATLLTEQEIPPTGIVTVLAFTRGEEAFHDNNGNGVFEPGIDTITGDNQPEPFIDFRPLPGSDAACLILPPSPLCNARYDVGRLFELFVDDSDDGVWNTQGGNGIWDNDVLVFDFIPVTFSGPLVTPVVSPTTFAIPNGGAQAFTIEVHDDLFNPLVGGSTIAVTANGGTVSGSPITVPDSESFNRLVNGLNRFTFVVGDAQPAEDPPQPPAAASVVVTVTSQNGNGTFIVASGTID